MYGSIYIITNLVNGKQYVGQVKRGRILPRWKRHIKDAKDDNNRKPLYRAIRKYGYTEFTVELLWQAIDQNTLDISECLFIKIFNTISPNGYNLTSGGNKGAVVAEEVREKVGKKSRAAWSDPKARSKRLEIWKDEVYVANHRSASLAGTMRARVADPLWKEKQLAGLSNPLIKNKIANARANARGTLWANDGTINIKLKIDEPLPVGFSFGQLKITTKTTKNCHWITNNKEQKLLRYDEDLPDGWKYGQKLTSTKTTKNRRFITNGSIEKLLKSTDPLPDGWKYGRLSWWNEQSREKHRIATTTAMNDPFVKSKLRVAVLGRRWINNGIEEKLVFDKPENWSYGRLI